MDALNNIAQTTDIPLLAAFALGLLTAVSPCPLATNITAIAFISKEVQEPRKTVYNGLAYAAGRALTYLLISILFYVGFASLDFERFLKSWGDKALGPFLIITGLVMVDVIKLNLKLKSDRIEKLKSWLAQKGYLGSLLLGALFALAFCPYSGVMFFGVLMPLMISASSPIFLPLIFSLGTSLPVIIFSVLIAFSLKKLGTVYDKVKKAEKWVRLVSGGVFILAGIYYLQYLIAFLLNR